MLNKYAIIEFISNGKFGNVFKGKNRHTGELVAIKTDVLLDNRSVQSQSSNSPLITYKDKSSTVIPRTPTFVPYSGVFAPSNVKYETRILNYLYNKKCKNIPLIYWYGLYKDAPALVMPYYEISVYELYSRNIQNSSKYHHSITHPIMNSNSIMQTVLKIVADIHDSGVVHRDIKPHNFMIKNQEVFLIDFGMATFYVDDKFRHIKEATQLKEHLMGTRKYISFNVHSGKEYSRRDDLISLGYLYLFLQNQLFWDRTFIVDDQDLRPNVSNIYPETHILHPQNQCVKQAKELSTIEKCLTANYTTTAEPIYQYLRYVYALDFSETPNYYLLRKHFA